MLTDEVTFKVESWRRSCSAFQAGRRFTALLWGMLDKSREQCQPEQKGAVSGSAKSGALGHRKGLGS